VQWTLLSLLLLYGILSVVGWNSLFRPRVGWGYAFLVVAFALAPHFEALRTGFVYGPLDTNQSNLPWAQNETDLQYRSRGGILNDVTLQLVPWQEEVRRQLLSGHLPLLNPSSASGEALLGNGQSAPFALTSVLSLPVDARRSQVARSFVKLLLALLGVFAVARELGVRPVFASLAALAYGYGGSIAVWRLFPLAEVMAIWPFAYLATEQLLTNHKALRPRLLLFLSIAGLCLAGHPESAAMALLALAGRWIVALIKGDSASRQGVFYCAAIVAASILATSFFTLPVAQNIMVSQKLSAQGHGRDSGFGQPADGAGWASLLNDAAPGLFGTPQRSSERGWVQLQWMAEGSVGLVSLALAVGWWVGWRTVRRPHQTYLLLLASLCAFVYFNPLGIAGRLFALPLLSAVARQYLGYLMGFAIALLAGCALEEWCADEPTARQKLALASATAVALLGAAAARAVAVDFWRQRALVETLPASIAAEVNLHFLLAFAAVFGIAACFLLRSRPLVLGALLVVLTGAQLWRGYGRYTPTVSSRAAMPSLPIVEEMKKDPGPFRVLGTRGVFFPNSAAYYGLLDGRTHDPTEWKPYVDWMVEFLDLDTTTYKKQYRRTQPKHEPYLRLLSVKYLLSGPDLRLRAPWLDRGVFGLTRLWELAGPVHWGFFPEQVMGASDAPSARRALQGRDPKQFASLESLAIGPDPQANGLGRVLGETVNRDRLRFEVSVPADAWLVVSQAAIPGWRASADGRRAALAVADGCLLAVQVPAGTHLVSLRYLPTSFLVGSVVSALTLSSIALYGFVICTRRRRLIT
jgi:hypothetical protein